MAFFDDLKDKATDLGRAGMAKSKQLMEITRLSLNNSGEEDAIRKAYLEIGKLYYAERGGAPEPGYAALCQRITVTLTATEKSPAMKINKCWTLCIDSFIRVSNVQKTVWIHLRVTNFGDDKLSVVLCFL